MGKKTILDVLIGIVIGFLIVLILENMTVILCIIFLKWILRKLLNMYAELGSASTSL